MWLGKRFVCGLREAWAGAAFLIHGLAIGLPFGPAIPPIWELGPRSPGSSTQQQGLF